MPPKSGITRVLAFDPGFERLGVAVIERQAGAGASGKNSLIHSDCIRTSATLSFPERLRALGTAAEQLIAAHAPDAVALEDVYFEKNAKTAMKVAQVRGMLCYIAAARGIAVLSYTPLEVKVAVTGYGKSDKAGVAAMVPRLIVLPDRKRLDDEFDAIAIGLTCLATTRPY